MKRAAVAVLCILMLCLAGCWDLEEIENRAYVLGIAVDTYPPIPVGGENFEEEADLEEEAELIHMEIHTDEPTYAMTIQIPIIKESRLLSLGEAGGGGSSQKSRTWEITQVGNSMMEMSMEMASRTNHTPYYRHLQVVIISEDVARKGLNNIIDFFDRDYEMRKRVRLYISKGEAKKVLDVVPRIEDFSSLYLAKLPMNADVNPRIPRKSDLGHVLMKIHADKDFVLPEVVAVKDEVKAVGASVFRGDKMVGRIGDLELEAINLIRGLYIGGVFTAKDPDPGKGIIAMEVNSVKTKIHPDIQGDLPVFNVAIDIEGFIVESVMSQEHGLFDKEHLNSLEMAFEQKIEKQCDETVKRLKEDLNADVFMFGDHLRAKKPEYWDKVKDNWREVYADAGVNIDVKVNIIHTGSAR